MSAIPDSIIVLPSLDLKDGGSLEQALSNLSQLENQFSKLCSNLDQRLANLKGKLGQINSRIGTSRQKIDTLKEINEAITIVSPSKFVRVYKKGPDAVYHQSANTDYVNNQKVPLFNYNNSMNLNTNIKPTDANANLPNQRLSISHHDDELRKIMKLTRGTLKPKRELFSGPQAVQNQKYEGLGRIPRDVKYIDSLLVFNSKQNPYQKYSSFDNLMSNSQINVPRKKQQKHSDKINLEAAPKTLVAGDVLQQFDTESYSFKPEARELPQLQAPTQLGLQGIVNINMNNFDFDPLAPSRGGTVNRPTIPDPKFVEEQSSSLLNPALVSMQRFSHIGNTVDNNNASNTQTNTSQPQNQGSGNNYSFSPVISQTRSVNVQQTPQMNTSTVNSQPRAPVQQQQQSNPGPNISTPQPVNNAPQNPIQPAGSPTKQPNPLPPKPTSGRAAFLDEIRNPKMKLKKAVKEDKPAMERKAGAKPEAAMSHMDHLKQQIQLRFQALNKNKATKEEHSSDEDD